MARDDRTKAQIYMDMKKMTLAEAREERRAFWGRFYDDQVKFSDIKFTLKKPEWIEKKLKEDGF